MNSPERHPLEPFLPEGARLLMLGSFPPQRRRWSMEFFYPNLQNDMWRVVGYLATGDRMHFLEPGGRRFDRARIEAFCRGRGVALYDTAEEVIRLKDNASDNFLQVVPSSGARGRSRSPSGANPGVPGACRHGREIGRYTEPDPRMRTSGRGRVDPGRVWGPRAAGLADALHVAGLPAPRGVEGRLLPEGFRSLRHPVTRRALAGLRTPVCGHFGRLS